MLKKLLYIFVLLGVTACTEHEELEPMVSDAIPLSLSVSTSIGRARSVVDGDDTFRNDYTIYLSSYFTSATAPESDTDYFIAKPFRYQADSDNKWSATPTAYWPLGGSLDLLGIACEKDLFDIGTQAIWHEGNCAEGVELKVDDDQCLDSEILFATSFGRKVDDNPENLGRVDMTFHHAQTWIQFKATCEQNLFRIDNIVVENVYTGGLFRVANGIYTDADWIFRGHRKTNVSVPNSSVIVLDKNEPKVLNILLPEQPACDIVIHYSRRSSEESDEWTPKVYRYPAGSDTWFYGEKYVLNLNFTE